MNGPFVIVCDHASNFIPAELNNLGLSASDLSRHIAWDIGAAGVARMLAERFDSPLILGGISRLAIDFNRHLTAHDLIPEVSDGTIIPGNCNPSEEEKRARIENYFIPYHDEVEKVMQNAKGKIFLSVHSMTECLKGQLRPWPISLSSFEDRTLVDPLLAALRSENGFAVGDNEPYNLDPAVDYSTPYHAIRRGQAHLQVEFRQDEVGTEAGQKLWAGRFGDALAKAGILNPAFA
jgi:predicted N-formylglutamate amidohydrolase